MVEMVDGDIQGGCPTWYIQKGQNTVTRTSLPGTQTHKKADHQKQVESQGITPRCGAKIRLEYQRSK